MLWSYDDQQNTVHRNDGKCQSLFLPSFTHSFIHSFIVHVRPHRKTQTKTQLTQQSVETVHDLLRKTAQPTTEKKNYTEDTTANIQGGPKPDHFVKFITPVYDDIGRRSIYQNVQLFIGSKTDILNVAIFKYSLHMFRETILH